MDPAVEAWLMRPEVMGVGEHASGFDPDNLLVDKKPACRPCLLDQCLPPVGMPLIHSRIGLQVFESEGQELAVELN